MKRRISFAMAAASMAGVPAGTAVPALADATANDHTCTAVFISGFAPEFLRGGSEGLNASTRAKLGERGDGLSQFNGANANCGANS